MYPIFPIRNKATTPLKVASCKRETGPSLTHSQSKPNISPDRSLSKKHMQQINNFIYKNLEQQIINTLTFLGSKFHRTVLRNNHRNIRNINLYKRKMTKETNLN